MHLWEFQVGLGLLNGGLPHCKPGPQTPESALPGSLLEIQDFSPYPRLKGIMICIILRVP